jgi:hypothetical protein
MVAVELPAPDVQVTTATSRDPSAPAGSVDVVVSRDGRGRSYRANGGCVTEVVQDAVRKILADPYSGEWIPRG